MRIAAARTVAQLATEKGPGGEALARSGVIPLLVSMLGEVRSLYTVPVAKHEGAAPPWRRIELFSHGSCHIALMSFRRSSHADGSVPTTKPPLTYT